MTIDYWYHHFPKWLLTPLGVAKLRRAIETPKCRDGAQYATRGLASSVTLSRRSVPNQDSLTEGSKAPIF